MSNRIIKVFNVLHKNTNKTELYSDLTSVERMGLLHNGKTINADYMRKIIKLKGVFENDLYQVKKGVITIIKNKK